MTERDLFEKEVRIIHEKKFQGYREDIRQDHIDKEVAASLRCYDAQRGEKADKPEKYDLYVFILERGYASKPTLIRHFGKYWDTEELTFLLARMQEYKLLAIEVHRSENCYVTLPYNDDNNFHLRKHKKIPGEISRSDDQYIWRYDIYFKETIEPNLEYKPKT